MVDSAAGLDLVAEQHPVLVEEEDAELLDPLALERGGEIIGQALLVVQHRPRGDAGAGEADGGGVDQLDGGDAVRAEAGDAAQLRLGGGKDGGEAAEAADGGGGRVVAVDRQDEAEQVSEPVDVAVRFGVGGLLAWARG